MSTAAGDWTQVLVVLWQALCPLNSLLSLSEFFSRAKLMQGCLRGLSTQKHKQNRHFFMGEKHFSWDFNTQMKPPWAEIARVPKVSDKLGEGGIWY